MVLKFGGTSVGSVQAMQQVIQILAQKRKQLSTETPLIVVASAMGGTTDQLLDAGNKAAAGDESYKEILKAIEERHLSTVQALLPIQQQSKVLSLVKRGCNELEELCNSLYLLRELSLRSKDRLMSYGELLSTQMLAAALLESGVAAKWQDARELIKTNSQFGNAAVQISESYSRIKDWVSSLEGSIGVLPGFIASNQEGVTTTLGRGGSDYTAALVAAAINASDLEIWTDVSGMMTADPRMVADVKVIPTISYQEAMELSHFGAKVIYPPTIQPVMEKGIPTWVKNTFAPQDLGTCIQQQAAPSSEDLVRGLTSINKISLLSLEGSGMIGVPGFSKRLFEALANERINVILITQGSSEHSICVAVNDADAVKASYAVNQAFAPEIALHKLEPLKLEQGLAIIALVGDQMRSMPGTSGRMFGTLGKNGVNVRAIAQGSSEKNISAVIQSKDVRKALNALHEAFFSSASRHINLFIAGVGNVGGKLLQQLAQQQQFLLEQERINLRVVGLINSKKMLIDENGIDLHNWRNALDAAENASLPAFVSGVIGLNLPNSVVVDVTAHQEVAAIYAALLKESVSIVACNKIAASSAFSHYKQLKDLARQHNANFLFETNVGAALPIIGTLKDLRRSGDRVNKMEAVLSGTLNFVFNNYDGTRTFAEVVRQAQAEGYTEPDPRLDLTGLDVMRKILILARESGVSMEMDDIENVGFLPASCLEGNVEHFYNELAKHEAHFSALLAAAKQDNSILKFVATYENGKAKVGLQHIPGTHDFYHLYGKDNIVLFSTDRYPQQPLVVKGAGAGADVTASGVFADILRTI